MLRDLLQASMFLIPIGAAVGALAVLFRDRDDRDDQADEHDLTDYHEPEPFRMVEPVRRWLRVEPVAQPVGGPAELVDILPPAPPGMDAGSPLWRQLVVEQVVPTLPDAAVRGIADEWLREIGEEARAQLELAR